MITPATPSSPRLLPPVHSYSLLSTTTPSSPRLLPPAQGYSLLPMNPSSRLRKITALPGAAGGCGSRTGRNPRRLCSPRVVVDMPTSLAPAQGCVVAVVDTARVVAEGVQLVHRASCGVGVDGTPPSRPCPPLPSLPGPPLPHSPALSLAKSPRLSRCSGKSTPTELFLMEPREAEKRLRSKP